MKFAALIASAAAVKIQPKMHKGLSLAQAKAAVEQVFEWSDRDDSGAVDVYEFIFGIGWICGYYEYEPTEEDAMALYEFWMACDTDANGELTLDEVYAYEAAYGFE